MAKTSKQSRPTRPTRTKRCKTRYSAPEITLDARDTVACDLALNPMTGREFDPLARWRASMRGINQALAMATVTHRRIRESTGGCRYCSGVGMLGGVVIKTMMAVDPVPTDECGGEWCESTACMVHREILIMRRFLDAESPAQGAARVLLPTYERTLDWTSTLVFARRTVDLFDYIRQHEPLPETLWNDVIRPLHLGLVHMHEVVGVTHGDIKLENIVLRAKGPTIQSVEYIDLDQAVELDCAPDRANTVLGEGTPKYVDLDAVAEAQFPRPTPLDCRELTTILRDRDFWMLAMTGLVACRRRFPNVAEPPGNSCAHSGLTAGCRDWAEARAVITIVIDRIGCDLSPAMSWVDEGLLKVLAHRSMTLNRTLSSDRRSAVFSRIQRPTSP